MQHVKDRWAETHLAEWPDPTHERHCRHAQPEAAHAASELEDWEPMSVRDNVQFWLILLGAPAAVIAIGLWVALS